MKLTLETQRLILRPFTMEDAEPMFTCWASDPEVTKYLTWNEHKSPDDTKAVLEKWIAEYEKPERLNFAIESKADGMLIGGIDIVGYLDGTPVIGYNLGKKYWNKGYMTEACKCLLDYLFSRGFAQVRIDARIENIASNRVIQKCGGVFVRTEEHYLPMKNETCTINHYIVKADSAAG